MPISFLLYPQVKCTTYFKESFKAGIYSVFCLQNAEFCETIEKKQPAGRR